MPEGSEPGISGTSPIMDPESAMGTAKKMGMILANASVCCGRSHVLAAYMRARRNTERGTATGSSLATEFFRQLTGERQVSVAIEKARVRKGEKAVLIGNDPEGALAELGLEEDGSALRCTPEKLRNLGAGEEAEGIDDCEAYAMELSALLEAQ